MYTYRESETLGGLLFRTRTRFRGAGNGDGGLADAEGDGGGGEEAGGGDTAVGNRWRTSLSGSSKNTLVQQTVMVDLLTRGGDGEGRQEASGETQVWR